MSAVMNDYHWASFEVVFPDGNTQILCCELSHISAIDAILDYLDYTNAKLLNLRNFMSNEIIRLKEARNKNGESFFTVD
jgi:hypothetical protein